MEQEQTESRTEEEQDEQQEEQEQPQDDSGADTEEKDSEDKTEAEQESDEAKKKVKQLEEEGPPDKLEDWPEDAAKYETFGGPEGEHGYHEGPEEQLGPSNLRHREDGSVEIEGEEADDPEQYKTEPVPGGPTDPDTPNLRMDKASPDDVSDVAQKALDQDDDSDSEGEESEEGGAQAEGDAEAEGEEKEDGEES
jgi:hypothetical protein